jgi:cysteine desulfurase
MAGIACSGGSACATGAVEPSHVLTAMGVERSLALSTLRFSLGHDSTDEDIQCLVSAFPGIVTQVRQLSRTLGRA